VVGTGHFTPPELQSLKSFVSCARTSNHDNFGLAVLIFHLLFFGRHPFAGIHVSDQYISLEEKIEKYWYAYSRSAIDMRIKPPPGTLPVAIAGERVEDLFERAFSRSSTAPRPTSLDWVKATYFLRY
jgi:DNA-binding helix-hairpin-helix protein with protein kinase domain